LPRGGRGRGSDAALHVLAGAHRQQRVLRAAVGGLRAGLRHQRVRRLAALHAVAGRHPPAHAVPASASDGRGRGQQSSGGAAHDLPGTRPCRAKARLGGCGCLHRESPEARSAAGGRPLRPPRPLVLLLGAGAFGVWPATLGSALERARQFAAPLAQAAGRGLGPRRLRCGRASGRVGLAGGQGGVGGGGVADAAGERKCVCLFVFIMCNIFLGEAAALIVPRNAPGTRQHCGPTGC